MSETCELCGMVFTDPRRRAQTPTATGWRCLRERRCQLRRELRVIVLGYTRGRCIYCGQDCLMIACRRHAPLLAIDPGVPRSAAT